MAEALTGDWINGLGPEESGETPAEEPEESEAGPNRRDRSKQHKFNVLLAAAVPEKMKTEWEALSAGGNGKRKNLTKFIEDSVSRDPETGKLALACEAAEVTGESSLEKKQSTGWGDKGLPRTLFKGRFGLSDEQLRAAILNDEVSVVTQDNVVFCQWRTLKSTSMDERRNVANIKSEALRVSGCQAGQLQNLFDSVSMERPEPTEEDLRNAAASSAAPPTVAVPTIKAIEDKKEEPAVPAALSEADWSKADGLLKKAESAVEKLKKVLAGVS
ncbi:unnamed protein product [Symbiodinium sp. CCMP2592]|nr:unnamed protein product [Symbiodinium sp. CCMP2592]